MNLAKTLTILVFAALASALLIGCNREEQQNAAAMERPPAAVMTADSVARDVPVYVEEIGKTAARESVTIQPQVGGKVTEIHFVDGANVKQGDLLFTIDPRPFEAVLQQAQATLAQNRANLEWSRSELKRVQGLTGTGAVSAQEVESKQNAVAVAEAQIKAGEAAVEQAELNLAYCTIRSPIAGRAGQRLVDAGNIVTSGADGGTRMLVIQRLDPIYADFTIPERHLNAVREHMRSGALKTQVWIPEQPKVIRDGELTFLDNMVQPGAGTVKLRATLPNTDAHFWPGQFVNVRLVLDVKKDAVLVPAQAPQVGQEGQYVFVVTPDSTAELRPVQLGQRQGEMVVIDTGLKVGERVVTQGHMGVMPGGKVQPIAPTTQPAPTPNGAVAEGATNS